MFTASSILRESRPDLDLTSGHLIDDHTVTSTLRQYLNEYRTTIQRDDDQPRNAGHYFLDGFPRTLQQIEMMEWEWHIEDQVHFALQLDVPDAICEQKMLGRRQCTKCDKFVNLANVQMMGFDLPPQLPKLKATDHDTEFPCDEQQCLPERDWTTRDDDTPEIVQQRLALYRDHEKPILDFYRKQGRLLTFTPYKGQLDIPRLQWTVEAWIRSFDK